MKARGIVVIDYDIEGGFLEAAEEQQKLQEAIASIVKGNKRGKLEIQAVVSPDNISHRRAAELTGGTVLNIESEFAEPLAALGDRIAETVAVALDPVEPGASFYKKSLKVLVNGVEVPADPTNGYVYDQRSHSIRFVGTTKDLAFTAMIDVTYEEHL